MHNFSIIVLFEMVVKTQEFLQRVGERDVGYIQDCSGLPYLIPQALTRYYSNLVTYSLVCLEVKRELGIVAFDHDFGGLLDRLEWSVRLVMQFCTAIA